MKGKMNIIDLIGIVPFYVALVLDHLEDLKIIGKAAKTIRFVRILRIIRVFKLVRHFAGLQSLIGLVCEAYKEFCPFAVIVSITLLTFSTFLYFAEKSTTTGKQQQEVNNTTTDRWTLINCIWWCLMTLTTVGNGTAEGPTTSLGRAIGGLCAITGVLILSFPVSVMVHSFTEHYRIQTWRNLIAHRSLEWQKLQKRMSRRRNAIPGARLPGAMLPGVIPRTKSPKNKEKY